MITPRESHTNNLNSSTNKENYLNSSLRKSVDQYNFNYNKSKINNNDVLCNENEATNYEKPLNT